MKKKSYHKHELNKAKKEDKTDTNYSLDIPWKKLTTSPIMLWAGLGPLGGFPSMSRSLAACMILRDEE
jgi:hypothetical protein